MQTSLSSLRILSQSGSHAAWFTITKRSQQVGTSPVKRTLVNFLLCAQRRYLETYKMFERKPPDLIMEKQEVDFVSRAQDVLTSGRKVGLVLAFISKHIANETEVELKNEARSKDS